MHLLVPWSDQVPAGGELHFHLLKGGDAKQVVGCELNWIFCDFVVQKCQSILMDALPGSSKSGPEIDECTRKAWDVFFWSDVHSLFSFGHCDGDTCNLI